MTKSRTIPALALTLAASALVVGVALAETGPMPPADAPMGPPLFDQFDAIDADKDGKATKAELDAWRTARFAEADADKDGSLNKDELAAWQLKIAQARMADRAARMIDRMDADDDGKISAAEMPVGKRDGRLFDMADADGDGAVSKDEAQIAMNFMQQKMGGKRGGWHGKGHGDRGHGRSWDWGWN